jgi:hypothetical protein
MAIVVMSLTTPNGSPAEKSTNVTKPTTVAAALM